MSTLTDSLDRVVTALQSTGMHATTDPRNIAPPCAWVTIGDVRDPTLCGGIDVRAAVCLIAADNGTPHALDALGDLLDSALTVLTLEEPAKPMTVTPPGVAPLPALVITTTT